MSKVPPFDSLLDRYFSSRLRDNPVEALRAGMSSGEGKLHQPSASFLKDQQKKRVKLLEDLDSIPPSTLENEQHLDRLAVRSLLSKESFDFKQERCRKDPDAVELVLDLLLHELMRGEDEPKRASRNLDRLLKVIPSHMAAAARLVTHPEPNWLKNMQDIASGADTLLVAIETFQKRHRKGGANGEGLSRSSKAIRKYRTTVEGSKKSPRGSYAIGAGEMQRRVQQELGLDYTLGEIESLAYSEIERVTDLLEEACAPFGRNRSPMEVIAKAQSEWDAPEDIVRLYRKKTSSIASAFRKAKAVTFPKNDELEVKLVPSFMKNLFPLGAYSAPGAFDARQKGIFWVNDLGLYQRDPVKARIERQQHFSLALTCAHEAYPGHHLQFVTANRHPRKWRPLFAHAVFYEGWTLWCEQMTADLAITGDPLIRIQQLHDALWRCHRILADLYLQNGEFSYSQAVRHMQQSLGTTRARAAADVSWYFGSPCVPMAYWLGKLENERLYDRLVKGRGWSLRKFNDWLLSFGTLPQSWIEKYGLD